MEEKRSWAEKLAVVRAFEASGKPRQEFCRAIGLAPTTMDGWRQRARESQRLVPLEVKPGGWGGGAWVALTRTPKLRTQTAPKKVNAMESDQPQAKPKCERLWTLPASNTAHRSSAPKQSDFARNRLGGAIGGERAHRPKRFR